MKMILANVNPHKKFNRERSILVRLQIDNSLELGWKKEDIILATNFDYAYRGVKSILVEDENYCGIDDRRYSFKVSSHIFIIDNLFRLGIVRKNELYFYHDFDAYQLEKIDEKELQLGNADMAMTDYGWAEKWNLGVIFFKQGAKDILSLLKTTILENKLGDERSFRLLVGTGQVKKDRYKKLNITYNFGMRHIGHNYQIANKPLKIVHFHPCYRDAKLPDTTMNLFFHGRNELNKPLMNERLKRIFRSYGFDESYGTSGTYNDFISSIGYDSMKK